MILLGIFRPVEGINSKIRAGECPKIPWKVASQWGGVQAEISEAALQEPFIMRKYNRDLFHMQQSNVPML